MSRNPWSMVVRVAERPAFVSPRKALLNRQTNGFHGQSSTASGFSQQRQNTIVGQSRHLSSTAKYHGIISGNTKHSTGRNEDAADPGVRRSENPSEAQRWLLDIQDLPTPSIYTLLRKQATAGNVDQTRVLVGYLVQGRGEAPNARLYIALILANVSPEQGSAEQVTQLLREMEAQKLALDSSICHAVLKVLSVHVDHLLRADILDHMHRRWFDLSAEGRQHVAAALLREGDLESGLQAMTELQAAHPESVPAWLIEMATDLLLEASEIGSALDLVMSFSSNNPSEALSAAAYQALLDEASMHRHLGGTLWAWNSQVAPGHLEPGAGVCFNVLATAAHHGDAGLATEAFQRLGALGNVLTVREYELMCQVHLMSARPDINAALATLTIMSENGTLPTAACTRPLYTFLSQKPRYLPQAFHGALELQRCGRQVPLAILNTLLEVHASRAELAEALEVYRSLPNFEAYSSTAGGGGDRVPFANADTFDLMYATIENCRSESADGIYDTTMAIWDDQQAIGIPMTEIIRGRLASICRRFGQTEQAEVFLRGNSDQRLMRSKA